MKIIDSYFYTLKEINFLTKNKIESEAETELIFGSNEFKKYFGKSISKIDIFGKSSDLILEKNTISFIDKVIKQRSEGIPIQYILDEAWFYGHKFHVYLDEKNKSLIPRSETELIVEEALKYIQKNNLDKILALDVGTGSCCIPISIIMNSSRNIIFDSIDPHTYKIAKKNILEKSLNNLISLYEYEIDDILTNLNKKYDIVTANLPYISDRNVIKELHFEPDKALYAKDNGSFFIKKLVEIIPKILNIDGIVIFEIDPSLTNYFENLKMYNIKIIKDFNDFNRVVLLSFK